MTTATMTKPNNIKPSARLLPSIADSPEHYFIKLHLTALSRNLGQLLQPSRLDALTKAERENLDPRFFFTNRGKDGKFHRYTFELVLTDLGILPELKKRTGFDKLRKDRAWWAAASYVEQIAPIKPGLPAYDSTGGY